MATNKQTKEKKKQPAASANTGFSYDPFKESSSTLAADKNRQSVYSQKPGDFSYGEYQKGNDVKQAEALLRQHLSQKPGDYSKGEAVLQAEALLQQQLSQKPGQYQSAWQDQLNQTMQQILNRDKFSYDLNGDALYQQYKDQYVTQGKMAMMDTMGQAQAMTGGYGNSYAQSVGQQAYQGYLQQLNDKVPELYQLALDQYNREGQDLYNQYGLYADRENQDYGRYRDSVSDYYTELDRLTDDARYQSETDYGRYRDQVSDYYTELDRLTNDSRYQSETEYNRYLDQYNMAYGEHRDSVSDWQQERDRADAEYWNQYERDYGQYTDGRNFAYDNYWNTQKMDYQKERDKVSDEQWQKEFDEAKRQYDQQYSLQTEKTSGGSGGSGDSSGTSKKSSGGGYNNAGYSADLVKKAQQYVGASADGKWGSDSAAKAKAKGYGSIAEVLKAMGYTPKGALEGNPGDGGKDNPAPTRDFKWVGQQLNNYISNGASKSECHSFLASALQAGYITQAQYNSLKNTFVPRGYTY